MRFVGDDGGDGGDGSCLCASEGRCAYPGLPIGIDNTSRNSKSSLSVGLGRRMRFVGDDGGAGGVGSYLCISKSFG